MNTRYAFGEHPRYVPDFGDKGIAPEEAGGNEPEAPDATQNDPIQSIGRQATEASIKEEPR